MTMTMRFASMSAGPKPRIYFSYGFWRVSSCPPSWVRYGNLHLWNQAQEAVYAWNNVRTQWDEAREPLSRRAMIQARLAAPWTHIDHHPV